MHTYFFKHEFFRILKQKKNIFLVGFLFVLMLAYILFIYPQQKSIYTFDEDQAVASVENLEAGQRGKERRDATGFSPMSGFPVYAVYHDTLTIQKSKIHAFQNRDYERFLRLTTLDMRDISDNIRSKTEDSPFPGKDVQHKVQKIQMMYESYITDMRPISYTMVEQKTALQSLYRFLVSPGIFLLLFCVIYFTCDVLVKDRQNQTVLQGLPISWYRLINIKSAVAVLYTLLIIVAFLIVGLTTIGIQNGFGSLSLEITTLWNDYDEGVADFITYDLLPLGNFFALCASFLLLITVLFTRLNMVFSLLFKNSWVVLLLSSGILFMENIYSSRTFRELFGIDIGSYPQTYFDFGNVITGERMYLLNVDTITYGKGLIILAVSILVVEIILFITSRIIGKRRFYNA